MKITEKQSGFVEIEVEDKDNALHLKGSENYTKGGRATILASQVSHWEETEMPAYTKAEYDAKVAELVRERYSESEEFALQRKAINAAFSPSTLSSDSSGALEEYATYNSYVEECKARAKDAGLYKPEASAIFPAG